MLELDENFENLENSKQIVSQGLLSKQALKEIGYLDCYEILEEHGKTFHVMAKLLGEERGKAIAALYGFARTSDDIVDMAEATTARDQTLASLNKLMNDLKLALKDASVEPNAIALAETIQKFEIALYPFEDLIAGVSMDLEKSRYKNYEELELYCYRVAGTIGLMITPVAGFEKHSKALDYAKTLGTAFQLTNILRDVGEDLRRGRIYLPQEELARFNISEKQLADGLIDSNFINLIEFQIKRAFALYREGEALIPLVTNWKGRLAFQFAIDAYSEILNKIRKNKYDVFTKRAHLTFIEKILMVPKSFFKSQFFNKGISL